VNGIAPAAAPGYNVNGGAERKGAAMNDVMTMEEIEARFDSEWVLIVDPEYERGVHVKRGRVACHSSDREEVYRKALELRPKHLAVYYIGDIPDGTAFAL